MCPFADPLPPLFQVVTTSAVMPAVSPTVSTTNRISVQTVERTDRILVHSALSSPANLATGDRADPAVSLLPSGNTVIIGHSPSARQWHRRYGCQIPGFRPSAP